MKRILHIYLCLALLILVSCSAAKDESISQNSSSTSTIEESSASEGADKKEEVINLTKPDIETISPTAIPQDHPIYRKNWSLKKIVGGNFFYRVKNGNSKGSMLYKNEESIEEYRFFLGYSPDLLIGDLYFSLVGYLYDGDLNVELNVYDLSKKTRKTVYSGPMIDYRSYLRKLSDTEVMFSYNGRREDGGRAEYVVTYNFVEDKCKTILVHEEDDWGDLATTPQAVTATGTGENKIYLIKRQRIDNQENYFLTCLDRDGNLLYEDNLEYLKKHAQVGTDIDYIGVYGDYIVVSYFRPNDNSGKPPWVIAKKVDGKYVEVNLNSNIYPSGIKSDRLIDDRYLVFSASADKYNYNRTDRKYPAHLFIFDIKQGAYRLIKYDIDGTDERDKFFTRADERGNLVISYTDDNSKDHYYYVPFEDLKL